MVNSWGDVWIGNVIYCKFAFVAVFDWEMVGLGFCELDFVWCIYVYWGFEDIVWVMGLFGMLDFLCCEDVVAFYIVVSGYQFCDFDFYEMYAAIQFVIVYLWTGCWLVHFGEWEMLEDLDEFFYNCDLFERMFVGTYFKEGV